MPKRKRSDSSTEDMKPKDIDKLLASLHHTIHHALKSAKGHERQRQSKRLRDARTAPDKKQRIQNEIVVLKSLDLHQTAHAHMCSALLRIKSVAESPRLPAEVKAGVAKPDLTEEEKAALHNVTSSLFAHPEARAATEKAVQAVCKALGVEVPERKRGKVKEGKEKESGTEERSEAKREPKAKKKEEDEKRRPAKTEEAENEDTEEDFDEIADKEEQALAKLDALLGSSEDEGDDEDAIRSRASKPSSTEQELDPMEITSGEEDNEEAEEYDVDLDPMDITSDEEEDGDDDAPSEDEDEDSNQSESGSFKGFSDSNPVSDSDDSKSEASSSSSSSALAPPRKKKSTKKQAPIPTGANSTFLPSLMGGYISDSNSSASDLDLMPTSMSRKNRRGQRARQAIWEKKFKEQAKHLKEGASSSNKRDAGWDMKRGAVDAAAGKPWKQGIRNPLLLEKKTDGKAVEGGGEEGGAGEGGQVGRGGGGGKARSVDRKPRPAEKPMNRKERRAAGIRTPVGPSGGGGGGGGGDGGSGGGGKPSAPVPKKRDDEGLLHPSWEARKKAKAMLEMAPYQGKKITFD